MPALGVMDVLGIYGFAATDSTLFLRHQDRRYPVQELLRQGWLELYQRYQSDSRFLEADQIVSFFGLPGKRAGFFGVYVAGRHRPARNGIVLPSCPWSQEWRRDANYFFDFERDSRFDQLQSRLVIDWRDPRTWIQRATNKTVVEISAPGRSLPPFQDYLDFSLSFEQLRALFQDESAHRDWKTHLSAVAGIYLILAEESGHLYVGSASGTDGIWGRWRQYARDGHAGNRRLQSLCEGGSPYPQGFRFSLLQIVPKTMPRAEVIDREQLYKLKLGSRATSLNAN